MAESCQNVYDCALLQYATAAMSIRTHYDNLQIPQDASQDEIRLAYRRLSKKYHPDLNQDPDAHRIMQLINEAYAVLSDPDRRAEHDRWIASQRQPMVKISINQPVPNAQDAVPAGSAATAVPGGKLQTAMMVCTGMLVTLLLWQVWYAWQDGGEGAAVEGSASVPNPASVILGDSTDDKRSGSSAGSDMPTDGADAVVTADFEPADGAYIRPTVAPNGKPWPKESGYLDDYPQDVGQAGNTLFVENIRNSSDVFAELRRKNQTRPLRTFFIKERSQIALDKLDAGEYVVRYRQLDSGELVESESVKLDGKQKENTLYLQRSKAPQDI